MRVVRRGPSPGAVLSGYSLFRGKSRAGSGERRRSGMPAWTTPALNGPLQPRPAVYARARAGLNAARRAHRIPASRHRGIGVARAAPHSTCSWPARPRSPSRDGRLLPLSAGVRAGWGCSTYGTKRVSSGPRRERARRRCSPRVRTSGRRDVHPPASTAAAALARATGHSTEPRTDIRPSILPPARGGIFRKPASPLRTQQARDTRYGSLQRTPSPPGTRPWSGPNTIWERISPPPGFRPARRRHK